MSIAYVCMYVCMYVCVYVTYVCMYECNICSVAYVHVMYRLCINKVNNIYVEFLHQFCWYIVF